MMDSSTIGEVPVSQQITFSQKRRSTRVYREIPLTVEGTDAFLAPYQDQVSTLTLNCHGCRYQTKHEVIQGDVVFLNLAKPEQGASASSSRARVRWVQRLANADRPFEVAVELETPGNIWGIATQPDDWFPLQRSKPVSAVNTGEPRPPLGALEPLPAANSGARRVATMERRDSLPAGPNTFAQLMAGFGEQIQIMASDAVKVAAVTEKSRLLEEFNVQLESETKKTLARVVAESKEQLIRHAMKELLEAHEVSARTTYERWANKLQQDTEESAQRMTAYGKEVSERIDNMALSTVERMQRNLEATQRDGMERFLTRLRERLAPVLADVQTGLEKLEGSAKIIKDDTDQAFAQFEKSMQETTERSSLEFQRKVSALLGQVESNVTDHLARLKNELESNAAKVVTDSNETLRNLSATSEQAVQEKLRALTESTADWANQILQQKSGELTRQFSSGLESYTRGYLETISKSLSEIPEKAAMHAKGQG
jgi:hypothetical protein